MDGTEFLTCPGSLGTFGTKGYTIIILPIYGTNTARADIWTDNMDDLLETIYVRNNAGNIYFRFGEMPLYSFVRKYENTSVPNYICKYALDRLVNAIKRNGLHTMNYTDQKKGV